MDFTKLIKKHKKKPLIDINSEHIEKVNYYKEDIEKILPNRDPFLFIDKISGIDLTEKAIICERKIPGKDHSIFKGHFPGFPVYPGVLQLEMISEAFCSLFFFITNNSVLINNNSPVNLVATRMHDAVLQHGLFPDDEVLIVTKALDLDDFTFRGIGQIIKGDQIPVLTIGEFYINE